MKLAYIDETYTTQESEWIVLGTFIFDTENWPDLESILRSKVDKYVWSNIIKGNLKNVRDATDERFDDGEPKEVSHRVYESLEYRTDYSVICVLINKTEYDSDRWESLREDPYLQAYVFLIERLEIFLTYESDKAMVFIDSQDSKQNKTIQDAHRNLDEYGTKHVNLRRVNGISIPLNDEDSYGLQLADWVVSAVKDHIIDGYTDEFFRHIEPHLVQSKSGDVLGSGLKVYPETYSELHGISELR